MDATRQTKIPTRDLFKIQNRTVLVTGGIGGVGSEVSTSILESGGDVVCFDLPKDPLDLERFTAVASKNGTRFSYYSVDVTDATAVSKSMEEAASNLRFPLRGLVTAAGISGEVDAVDYPADEFRKILDINVMGTFLVAQSGARVMQKHQLGGSVVLIASMSGSVANKGVNTSAYNSSKSAVIQLARSLAAEWGGKGGTTPIRVNSLSPGYIETPLSAGARDRPEVLKHWVAGNMFGRISLAEEYRAPVLFLLGDGSSFCTGHDLKVDGGHTSW